MSLTDCPDCGKPVSTEAYVCPACGRPTERHKGLAVKQWKKTIILWLALVVSLMVVWLLMGK